MVVMDRTGIFWTADAYGYAGNILIRVKVIKGEDEDTINVWGYQLLSDFADFLQLLFVYDFDFTSVDGD